MVYKAVTYPITHERLLEVLSYDQGTGDFRWKGAWGRRQAGSLAGRLLNRSGRNPYWQIVVDGQFILAHRLAWFYVNKCWPGPEIDHDDGDGLNNRYKNLISTDRIGNSRNMPLRKDSVTGATGVTPVKKNGKFRARIKVDGKERHLGYFHTVEEAAAARAEANARFGFSGNHGRES